VEEFQMTGAENAILKWLNS